MNLAFRVRRMAQHVVRRLGIGAPSDEKVDFTGRFILEPPDAFNEGGVLLFLENGRSVRLIDHLYDRLEVPSEDDLFPVASFHGRIRVEVLPDPDFDWTPDA